MAIGQYDRAETLHQECLQRRTALGDRPGTAFTLNDLGDLARLQGAYDQAEQFYQDQRGHLAQKLRLSTRNHPSNRNFLFKCPRWSYNAKLKKAGTKLEDIHQVIPATQRLRWLEIEEIDGEPEEIKATLDEACKIPRPQRISVVKAVVT